MERKTREAKMRKSLEKTRLFDGKVLKKLPKCNIIVIYGVETSKR